MESEILKKDRETEDLKCEIETLKRKNLLEDRSDLSLKFNEVVEISNENERLKENYEQLQEACESLQVQHSALQETLQVKTNSHYLSKISSFAIFNYSLCLFGLSLDNILT